MSPQGLKSAKGHQKWTVHLRVVAEVCAKNGVDSSRRWLGGGSKCATIVKSKTTVAEVHKYHQKWGDLVSVGTSLIKI